MSGFVAETDGLSSFPKRSSGWRPMPVPLPAPDPRAAEREEQRATLFDVMELAARFFEDCLAGRVGASARGYLSGRELGPALQQKFRLGYAPNDRSALKSFLASKGVSGEQMAEAGLVISGPDIPVSYDRFRDRVIFPITDLRGRIIAFGGRAMSPDQPAKYLNSPETPLFHKSDILYNAQEARRAATKGATIIAVEGYVDVIALVSAGFPGAVAPLGTALTENQLRLLWRFADEPVLCFDGDAAGLRAASRAIDLALPLIEPGKSVRFALLPEGQDPDDLIRAAGRQAMEDVIGSARPLADMLWRREAESGVFDTPERRAALEARVNELVRLIANEAVRRHYSQALGERMRAFFGGGETSGGRRNPSGGRGGPARGGGSAQGGRQRGGQRREDAAASSSLLGHPMLARDYRAPLPRREAVLVGAAVNHPSLVDMHFDEFSSLELGAGDLETMRRTIVEAVSADHAISSAALREQLVGAGVGATLEAVDRMIVSCREWYAKPEADPQDAEEAWSQALTLHKRAHSLHKELRAAELALANDPSEENFARLIDIQSELARADGTEALIEGFGVRSGRSGRTF
ncbi:MAG: DNA primase [Hyphomicrobiales bacterium]